MKNTLIVSALTAATLCATLGASAQRPERGKPPQVAIDACNNVAEGGSCQFEGRRGGTLSGTCVAVPTGDTACVPEGHRPPRDGDHERDGEDFS